MKLQLLKITLSFLSFLLIQPTFAQKKFERYLDKNEEICLKDSAVFIFRSQTDTLNQLQGTVKVYYLIDQKAGTLYYQGSFKDNQREGEYTFYYKDEQKSAQGNYSNGKKVGIWQYWHPNGKPKVHLIWKDGQSKIQHFWDSTGRQILKDGTGLYYTLQEGKVSEQGEYLDYEMHSAWKGWREGKLYFQEKWDKGKLIEGVSYDSEGKSYTYNQDNYMINAEYEGGMKALYQFLSENIKYPKIAKRMGTEGKVFVSFVVDKTGVLNDIAITRGIGSGCDEESLRVISLLPKWKPGIVRGQLAHVKYSMPIHFKLED